MKNHFRRNVKFLEQKRYSGGFFGVKIRSLSKLTRTYILALSLIALLTLGIFAAMHQVIMTQKDSARLINLSGSQRWLSQSASLLCAELVYNQDTNERALLRQDLLKTIELIRTNNQQLTQDNQLSSQMKSMYFDQPLNLEARFERFTFEAITLANDPNNLLTSDNPHYTYVLQNRVSFLKDLNEIVAQYQKESENKIEHLQLLDSASGAIILLTLVFLGLYIFRPLSNTLLNERIQLEQANQELALLSSMDGLTGIANRRQFDYFLSLQWSLASRKKERIALIMCDIDHFKAYNDHYGHLQGDECLKKVASALKKSVKRQGDLLARYGGEEFVVVLPNTDFDGAKKIAEDLRTNVEQLEIPHLFSPVRPVVTISLGVAILYPSSTALLESLIEAADQALYQAKQTGRNRIVFTREATISLS
jgi:diguanylate cyclase (GGDEF)-like protein